MRVEWRLQNRRKNKHSSPLSPPASFTLPKSTVSYSGSTAEGASSDLQTATIFTRSWWSRDKFREAKERRQISLLYVHVTFVFFSFFFFMLSVFSVFLSRFASCIIKFFLPLFCFYICLLYLLFPYLHEVSNVFKTNIYCRRVSKNWYVCTV